MKIVRSLAPRRVWIITLIGAVLVIAGIGACVVGFVDLLNTVAAGGALEGPVRWMFVALVLYAVGIPMVQAFAREQRRRKRVNSSN